MKSAVEHFQVDFLKEASTLLSGICRLQKALLPCEQRSLRSPQRSTWGHERSLLAGYKIV